MAAAAAAADIHIIVIIIICKLDLFIINCIKLCTCDHSAGGRGSETAAPTTTQLKFLVNLFKDARIYHFMTHRAAVVLRSYWRE